MTVAKISWLRSKDAGSAKAALTTMAARSATANFLKYPHALRCKPLTKRWVSNVLGAASSWGIRVL